MGMESVHQAFFRVVSILAFFISPTFATAQVANDPMLNEAIAGNEQSLGSIRSLFAKVEFSILPANQSTPSLAYTADYWRAHDLIRVKQRCVAGGNMIGQLIDYDCRQGIQRAITSYPGSSPNTVEVGMTITPATTKLILTDCWQLALFFVPQADSDERQMRTFSDACRTMTIKKASKSNDYSIKGVRVQLNDVDGSTYDVWIDSSVNWLIRKVVRQASGTSNYRVEYEAADYKEFQPGIFFPTKTEIRGYLNGSLEYTKKVAFSEIKINELDRSPIQLALPFRSGMPVKDDIKGLTYEVDSAGHPIGRSQPIRHAPPTVPEKAPPSIVFDTIADRSISFWIAIFSVILLFTALVIQVRSKWLLSNSTD
jgi:hypothetical protein